ncbi:MAG: ATP-binding protein [Firmicutes bacterium]|nr:ATP-binding protein [Bacillota bacterium]
MTYIVTGYYGSGKTEFVVNLAMELAVGAAVTIADLDVINPFFRSREREKELAPLGIEIMGSVFENHVAQDIPALSFAFLSRIRAGQDVIIDLAGGENGLKLLANCYDAIGAHEFLCVFNMYRPETDTPGKMIDFCRSINAISRLPVTGLVNNGNMLAYTDAEHVFESQKAVLKAGEELNLPLKYTLLQEDIYREIADEIVSEKVLTFAKPQMRKDWQK